MATSLITLNEKGFWAPDSLLEVFAYFVAEELEKSAVPGAREYARHLRAQATAGMSGCMDLRLSSLRKEEIDAVSTAAQEVVELMRQAPASLSAKRLTSLGLGGGSVFQSDVELYEVARLNSAFQMLLSGNWAWKPEDAEALPNHWLNE